uniref:Uncharacterized protein n=1 Tax=Arion vulgaris TaxID=1028688 RepID=A0A0B6YXM3_9EUPU
MIPHFKKALNHYQSLPWESLHTPSRTKEMGTPKIQRRDIETAIKRIGAPVA